MNKKLTDEEIKDAWDVQMRLNDLRRRIVSVTTNAIFTSDDLDDLLKRIAYYQDLLADIYEEAKDLSEDIARREWEEEFNEDE